MHFLRRNGDERAFQQERDLRGGKSGLKRNKVNNNRKSSNVLDKMYKENVSPLKEAGHNKDQCVCSLSLKERRCPLCPEE